MRLIIDTPTTKMRALPGALLLALALPLCAGAQNGAGSAPPANPAAAAAPAAAPAAPTTQQMIDALKQGKTRGLTRNLGVAAAHPAAEPAADAGGSAKPGAAPMAAVAARPADTIHEPEWPPKPGSKPAAADKPASIDLAIQFEFNSNKVLPDSQKILEDLAAALTAPELAGMRFMIEGHTDGKGQAAYNKKLSQARADQVKRVLVQHKVAANRLLTAGKGASELAVPADPLAAENRRVRILTLEH